MKNHKILKNASTQNSEQPPKSVEVLTKEVFEQKEIIRLYEVYVTKLEEENSNLKSKLIEKSLNEIKEDSQDSNTVGF
jgi:hypothetical protein